MVDILILHNICSHFISVWSQSHSLVSFIIQLWYIEIYWVWLRRITLQALGAVHKLRHLFWTFPDPYLPLRHLVSSFDIPPRTFLPDDVIYERENDISMTDFFVRRTLTAHGYFSSGSNFWCLWGEWFDFHCYNYEQPLRVFQRCLKDVSRVFQRCC